MKYEYETLTLKDTDYFKQLKPFLNHLGIRCRITKMSGDMVTIQTENVYEKAVKLHGDESKDEIEKYAINTINTRWD